MTDKLTREQKKDWRAIQTAHDTAYAKGRDDALVEAETEKAAAR